METIAHDGVVLAYVARPGELAPRTTFMTPAECNLQVGHVVYPEGSEIARHMHLPVERHLVGTTELLLVQRGRCSVDIYSGQREVVATCELGPGDIMIAVSGGHGFRVLEDTVLLEIKQGPFVGDEASKERF